MLQGSDAVLWLQGIGHVLHDGSNATLDKRLAPKMSSNSMPRFRYIFVNQGRDPDV